jgi:hypothetical protein
MEEKRETRVFIGKPEGRILLGRPKYRWDDDKMDLKEMG